MAGSEAKDLEVFCIPMVRAAAESRRLKLWPTAQGSILPSSPGFVVSPSPTIFLLNELEIQVQAANSPCVASDHVPILLFCSI